MSNAVPEKLPAARGLRLLLAAVLIAASVTLPGLTGPAAARPATGGEGRFGPTIDWVEWGPNGLPLANSGFTGQTTRTISGQLLEVTCQASNLTSNQGSSSPFLRAYRSGDWPGDALDQLYNIGGVDGANELVNGLANRELGALVAFDFSCSATLDSAPVPLAGLVFADAEQSNNTGFNAEFVAATPVPSTATFRIIDRYRQPGCAESSRATRSSSNRLQLAGIQVCETNGSTDPGPAAVAFMDGATSARVELQGGGYSAIGLGVVLATDYGDAPSTYGSAGHLASFEFAGGTIPSDGTEVRVNDPSFTLADATAPARRLGVATDPEDAPDYSPTATGDDLDGSGAFPPSDDEDGLVSPASVVGAVGDTYEALVSCGVSGDAVAGWIDFTVDGDFGDPGERAAATCAGGTATLGWALPTVLLGTPVGTASFLRLRTAASAAEIAAPTGLATTGEAEDHAITLDVGPQLTLTQTVAQRAAAGDQLRVAVSSNGAPLFGAQTSGSGTTATTGSRVAPAGTTLTITTAVVSGVGTPADYDSNLACADGVGAVPVQRTGPSSWTVGPLTSSQQVACAVTSDGLVPAISLTKTASGVVDLDGNGPDRGDRVDYSFAVTNTGEAVLTSPTFDESGFTGSNSLPAPTCPAAASTLDPAETATCTSSYALSQADLDAGQVVNPATVTAQAPNALTDPTSAVSTATVTLGPAPSLGLVMTATHADTDGDGALDAGEVITYGFTLTNTGNVALAQLAVTDLLLGPLTCPSAPLQPGTSASCADATYTVTPSDVAAGTVVTSATGSGTPPVGPPVTSAASTTTTPSNPRPALVLDKSAVVSPAAHQSQLEAGDVITYGFAVTNAGNVRLGGLAVSDPSLGPVSCATAVLEAGASTTCTAPATRSITQADVDAGSPVTNTATATATRGAATITARDTTSIPVRIAPALDLVKQAVPLDLDRDGRLEVGESVGFGFVVTNTGTVTLGDVQVDDPMLRGVTCQTTRLAPRGRTSCVGDAPYRVRESDARARAVLNTATVSATGARARTAASEDSVRIAISPARPDDPDEPSTPDVQPNGPEPQDGGGGSQPEAAAPDTTSVSPRDADLPDAGGPDARLGLVGAALLLLGATGVGWAARRRRQSSGTVDT